MSMIEKCGKESKNLLNVFKYLKYKIQFAKIHPFYFDADGILMFVGSQGSGKTLSAVNYIYQLMLEYPNVKLCTNLWLRDYPIVTYEEWLKTYKGPGKTVLYHLSNEEYQNYLFGIYVSENRVFPFVNNDDFIKYSNGESGLIFFVDEIQLYLNSLESKNVNMDIVTEISQQRKQRKHIVCTSQVFGRMAKPLREQFSDVVVCKKYLGCFQKNQLINRDGLDSDSSSDTNLSGTVKHNYWWIHTPNMYGRYDTYYKIQKGKFVGAENRKEIYKYDDNNNGLSVNN